jgi:hypothetical protein
VERTAAPPPGAHGIGRLRVSSDLNGTTFTTSPVLGRGVIDLSALDANVLSPARYEVRATYVDRDPLMGNVDHPTTARQTVDVVAGKTATLRFLLEAAVWRDRFERALMVPAGHGRATILDRTFRRLKALGTTTTSDETRYTEAVSQQQLVTFVKGDLAIDPGLKRDVRFKRVDVMRLDGETRRLPVLGIGPGPTELTRGRHTFEADVEVLHLDKAHTMTCSGSFVVPGGASTLPLKVDALVRRRPRGDVRVVVACQIGGTSPLLSDPPAAVAREVLPPALTVLVSPSTNNVVGATVVVAPWNPGVSETRVTDAEGRADFPGTKPGPYLVTVTLPGYSRASQQVTIEAGVPKRLLVTLRPFEGQHWSDFEGLFSFRVEPGRYDVVVKQQGYTSLVFPDVEITAARGARIEAHLTAGQPEVETMATRRPVAASGGFIAGSVVDRTGAPVGAATVTLRRAR